VLVVGGGPAGLAVATRLAEAGIGRVVLLEREPTPGGTPRHCGHYPFGIRECARLLRGPAYATRLVSRAKAVGVEILSRHSVMSLQRGPRLEISSPAGLTTWRARRVVLCTGIRESTRVERQIGGVRTAGVLSTGALQGLVYLDGLRPFRSPVIYGSELVSFSAILTCRHLGIRPVAMIEPEPRIVAPRACALLPRLLGMPTMTGTHVEAIEGGDSVDGVIIRDTAGETRRLSCDGIIVSGRFRPEVSLLKDSHIDIDHVTKGARIDRYLRCSDPHYFAAGNILRSAKSAGGCWQEGRQVADRVIACLQGRLPDHELAGAPASEGR